MTRDKWLERCAQRFIDKAEMDPGSAAACAREAALDQRQARGMDPARWDAPEKAAEDVVAYWDEADSQPTTSMDK